MLGTKKDILEWLQDKKEEDIFEITKKQEKSLLSRAQQKYYFGVIVKIISDFHGYTSVETHELIKVTFSLETTTDLNKDEFSAMCDIIRDLWNTKFNCYIPKPNESEEMQYRAKYL